MSKTKSLYALTAILHDGKLYPEGYKFSSGEIDAAAMEELVANGAVGDAPRFDSTDAVADALEERDAVIASKDAELNAAADRIAALEAQLAAKGPAPDPKTEQKAPDAGQKSEQK